MGKFDFENALQAVLAAAEETFDCDLATLSTPDLVLALSEAQGQEGLCGVYVALTDSAFVEHLYFGFVAFGNEHLTTLYAKEIAHPVRAREQFLADVASVLEGQEMLVSVSGRFASDTDYFGRFVA